MQGVYTRLAGGRFKESSLKSPCPIQMQWSLQLEVECSCFDLALNAKDTFATASRCKRSCHFNVFCICSAASDLARPAAYLVKATFLVCTAKQSSDGTPLQPHCRPVASLLQKPFASPLLPAKTYARFWQADQFMNSHLQHLQKQNC